MTTQSVVAVGLLLFGLGGCESLSSYDPKNFDQPDPASALQRIQPPFVSRGGSLATLKDNRLLLVGGIVPSTAPGATNPTNDVEIYDPATDAWTVVAPMSQFRSVPAAATTADGRVVVVGDNTASVNIIRNGAEVYNPGSNSWTVLPPPALATYEFPAALGLRGPGNRVLLTGSLGLVLLDVATGIANVVPGASFNGTRGAALALLKDGRALCTFGNRYYIFSPVTNGLVQTGQLRYTRYYAGATTADNGRVYIGGGQVSATNVTAAPVRGIEVYDPDSARLVRTPPGLASETGYASVGMYQYAQRILFLSNSAGDGLLDLEKNRAVTGGNGYPAGSYSRANGQLTDGRIVVLSNTIADLSKYSRP